MAVLFLLQLSLPFSHYFSSGPLPFCGIFLFKYNGLFSFTQTMTPKGIPMKHPFSRLFYKEKKLFLGVVSGNAKKLLLEKRKFWCWWSCIVQYYGCNVLGISLIALVQQWGWAECYAAPVLHMLVERKRGSELLELMLSVTQKDKLETYFGPNEDRELILYG
jgi:hypothetical protein